MKARKMHTVGTREEQKKGNTDPGEKECKKELKEKKQKNKKNNSEKAGGTHWRGENIVNKEMGIEAELNT